MIELSEYLNNFSTADSLPNKLNEPVFLKTELDIVYSDLSNWERNDLLYIRYDDDKGNWKKLNYVEYTWVCIVHELILFGFSYDEIRTLKTQLFDAMNFEDLYQGIHNSDKDDSFINSMSEFLNLIDKSQKSKDIMKGFRVSILELCIAEVVLTGEDYFIYFFKNNEIPFISWSNTAIQGYHLRGVYDLMLGQIKETHFAMSLSNIVSKYLIRDRESQKLTPYILTKEEYTILKMIRKNYKNIKSVNIRFGNDKMDLMEITTLKKATAESRIIDYIKKGVYQKITIDTQDGRIVNFENTQKIKL